MTSRTKWLVALLALCLVAAACSQGDGGDDTTTTTTGTAETTTTAGGEETTTTAGDEEPADDVTVDGVTATDDTIHIGMLADLSGPFATLVKDIVDAEIFTFDDYNAQGGVAGRWQIEVHVEDTGYEVTRHVEAYERLKPQVVGFTQSTGSPQTAAIMDDLVTDNLFAIPLSWYSGYSDPEIGPNILELGANYCVESMNIVEYQVGLFEAENGRLPTLGIVSLPGDYGQDGAAGAKYAAEELGLEIVYDGEARAVPTSGGNTEVIQALIDAAPDLVHVTLTPGALAEVFGGTTQQGLTDALWIGNGPSFNIALLGTPLKDELTRRYTHSGYFAPYGADVARMDELVAIMEAADPDRVMTEAFSRGWTEAQIMIAVLEAAAEAGDLTPAGVTAAALALPTLDFGGIAPAQTWAGDPDDFIVRGIYILEIRDDFVQSTVAEGTGHLYNVLEENYIGDLAANWVYEPCFLPT